MLRLSFETQKIKENYAIFLIKSGEKILLNKMIQIFIYIFTFHFNSSAITSNDDTNSIKRNFYLNA